ncbi:MAG: dethiobiotin synthase [Polyangiaceae bacterium]|jgi:dethiobiotin synthetase
MLIVVTGTGTGIGKTHFSEALLLAARAAHLSAAGVKPIESGVTATGPCDADRLRAASTFHVKPFGRALTAPVSPHLAARHERNPIQVEPILAEIRSLRPALDLLLVELPGGLFTPIAPPILNIDLASALHPDTLLLVAPDRLGVLHDVIAATRAARIHPLRIDGIVLTPPRSPDPSFCQNAQDIPLLTEGTRVLATLPWGNPDTLAATGLLTPLLPSPTRIPRLP